MLTSQRNRRSISLALLQPLSAAQENAFHIVPLRPSRCFSRWKDLLQGPGYHSTDCLNGRYYLWRSPYICAGVVFRDFDNKALETSELLQCIDRQICHEQARSVPVVRLRRCWWRIVVQFQGRQR